MYITFINLLLVVGASTVHGYPFQKRQAPSGFQFTTSLVSPPTFASLSNLVNSTTTFSLRKSTQRGNGTGANFGRTILQSITSNNQVNGVYGTSSVTEAFGSQVFLTSIKFGEQLFQVVIDTGSSDTWLAKDNFKCLDPLDASVEEQSTCAFGDTFNPSSTFVETPNQNFRLQYADGEQLTGIVGTETVTLAGIEVKNQTVGVVEEAAWNGDGFSSGLLGLAFPDLTNVYSGTDPSKNSKDTRVPYNPLFTNMVMDGTPPMFSVALSRNSAASGPAGVIAIGGIPEVPHDFLWAQAPFQLLMINGVQKATQYQHYVINIDNVLFGNGLEMVTLLVNHPSTGRQILSFISDTVKDWGQTLGNGIKNLFGKGSKPTTETAAAPTTATTSFQTVVDTGTTMMYLPIAVTTAFAAAFDPPVTIHPDYGVYATSCKAKAPIRTNVKIGGVLFPINPVDLLIPTGDSTDVCICGIQDSGKGPSILGDVFLTNVLAVFDIGASIMRFSARPN